MYGPIYESGTGANPIYFNPCPRNVASNPCKDRQGKPINTTICQNITVLGYTYDLGHVIGYYPNPSGSGLIVEYTDGSLGCGNWVRFLVTEGFSSFLIVFLVLESKGNSPKDKCYLYL